MSLSAREAKRDAIPGRLTDFYIPFNELNFLDAAQGTVNKAEYQGKVVAVKKSKNFGSDIYREIDTVTTLGLNPHTNITQFIGFTEESGDVSLIFEWVDFVLAKREEENHSPLKAHLLDPKNLIKFMLDIVNGIAHLHRHDIVWRDIRTENILVDKDMNPKLCSFGISILKKHEIEERILVPLLLDVAKVVAPVARIIFSYLNADLTKWNQFDKLEPLEGEAPECHLGCPPSRASDVWGFGVIMRNLVSNMPANCQQELMKWAEPLFKACLADKPEDRPTIQEIAEQLAKKINAKLEPIVAREKSITHLSTCYIRGDELEIPRKDRHYRQDNRDYRSKSVYKKQAVILHYMKRPSIPYQLQNLDVLAVLNQYPHPNVVTFHGITVVRGVTLVMENIDFIESHLKPGNPLMAYLSDPVNFLTFIIGIMNGIEHVQSFNIILKFITLNILGVGKQNEPKLVDMDGAYFENSKLQFQHTRMRTESPEVMRNWSYFPTTNSWNMGMVICDLHCRIKYNEQYIPYCDDEFPLDGIVKGTKTPKLPNDMIHGLADIVRPCFNFDPKSRPTIKELKEKTTLLMNSLFAAAQSQKQSEKNLPADKTKAPDRP